MRAEDPVEKIHECSTNLSAKSKRQKLSVLEKDPNCNECERRIVMCGSSCGFLHTLNKGEITKCTNCKQVYNDTGTAIGIHSL